MYVLQFSPSYLTVSTVYYQDGIINNIITVLAIDKINNTVSNNDDVNYNKNMGNVLNTITIAVAIIRNCGEHISIFIIIKSTLRTMIVILLTVELMIVITLTILTNSLSMMIGIDSLEFGKIRSKNITIVF